MSETSSPDVSAVVVAYDRAGDVDACLASIRAQTHGAFECLVVLNGATDALADVVARHAGEDPRIVPIALARTSASAARNVASARARGELVHFLDDDVLLPTRLFEVVVRRMREHSEVGILGGPNLTPDDEPAFCQITGALLAGRFGTGIARARYRREAEGSAEECDLILCNLVVRRSVLTSGIAFPGLFGGEENVLMGQARGRGVAMWYSPDAYVHHRRRRTLATYVEQVQRYGAGRANAMRLAPHTFRLAYFVPLAFTSYLALLPALAWLTPWALAPLGAYVLLDAGASLSIAIQHARPSWLLPLFVLHPVTHVVYAVGLGRRLASPAPLSRPARDDASAAP